MPQVFLTLYVWLPALSYPKSFIGFEPFLEPLLRFFRGQASLEEKLGTMAEVLISIIRRLSLYHLKKAVSH